MVGIGVEHAVDEVRRTWRELAGSGHDGLSDEIVRRHAEPHRRYHTIEHVMWVLRHIDDLVQTIEAALDRDVIRAAALYHDVIYDPRSTTNEADSALMAVDRLAGLGWAPARLAEVAMLINATAGHVAATTAAAVLLDADLAVLGGDPAAYAAYVDGVRFEYRHVPDEQWRAGRTSVLNSFLERPQIYATVAMRTEREASARRNLTTEIATLSEP